MGIAQVLMKEIETYARKLNTDIMYLSVNGGAKPAIGLYLKWDYKFFSSRNLEMPMISEANEFKPNEIVTLSRPVYDQSGNVIKEDRDYMFKTYYDDSVMEIKEKL